MIKVKVLCVFLHDEKVLVEERFSKKRNSLLYRPLGGSIEYLEHSADAIVREIKEEISANITLPEFLGVLEAIEEGRHEIFFVYNARFVEPGFYNRDIEAVEADGKKIKAVWKPLSLFIKREVTLYPEGLLELLMR